MYNPPPNDERKVVASIILTAIVAATDRLPIMAPPMFPGGQGMPSFNMMFAYFKQQGYNDNMAAMEARRMMSQYAFSLGRMPTQMYPPIPQMTNVTVKAPHTVNNRTTALGVIHAHETPLSNSWQIPTSATPAASVKHNAAKKTIPLVLKASKTSSKVHIRGYKNGDDEEATSSSSVPTQGRPGIPKEFSMDMAQKTHTGASGSKCVVDAPTMTDINEWIQRIYTHHTVGSSFKNFRSKISEYVENIVKKHRSGCLTRKDLFIPTEEQILGMQLPWKSSCANAAVADHTGGNAVMSDTNKSGAMGVYPQNMQRPGEGSEVLDVHVSASAKTMKGTATTTMGKLDDMQQGKIARRVQRFKIPSQGQGYYNTTVEKGKQIVGTSTALEKPYLRLTAEPNPSVIRPEGVLKRSFRHVFDTFMKNRNYRYIEEQLRSIRQDIQVQHLRSPFVIKLYATGARLALVHGDLDQFNQCQTQLMQLKSYAEGFPFYMREFDCYCFLYLAMQNMQMDILRYLRNALKSEFMNTPHYRYATAIRRALAEGNFVGYFRMAETSGIDIDKCLTDIYQEAFSTIDYCEVVDTRSINVLREKGDILTPPFYTKFLFKMFEPRLRMNALVNMASTSISLSMETIKHVLNFCSMAECEAFIRDNGGTLNHNGLLDCKKSVEEFMSSPLLRNKKL